MAIGILFYLNVIYYFWRYNKFDYRSYGFLTVIEWCRNIFREIDIFDARGLDTQSVFDTIGNI
jgi:hypothetical protein